MESFISYEFMSQFASGKKMSLNGKTPTEFPTLELIMTSYLDDVIFFLDDLKPYSKCDCVCV